VIYNYICNVNLIGCANQKSINPNKNLKRLTSPLQNEKLKEKANARSVWMTQQLLTEICFRRNKICVKHIVDPHWHDGAGAHGAQQLLTGLSGQKTVNNFFFNNFFLG
jgi:hypothetical protein